MLVDLLTHADQASPRECCGLLLGNDDQIVDSVRITNIADDPHRFLLEPQEHIEGRREARRRGLEVLGFYHSHPHSAAAPSATDLAEASYAGHLYAIVSPSARCAKVRVFRLEKGRFVELGFIETA